MVSARADGVVGGLAPAGAHGVKARSSRRKRGQRIGKVADRCPSLLAIFGEAANDDLLEVGRNIGPEVVHRRWWIIEKRGTPRAVLLSIRDYVRLAAPEPEVLRLIGEESRRKGTDRLTSRQIDQTIQAARAQNRRKRG